MHLTTILLIFHYFSDGITPRLFSFVGLPHLSIGASDCHPYQEILLPLESLSEYSAAQVPALEQSSDIKSQGVIRYLNVPQKILVQDKNEQVPNVFMLLKRKL